MPAILQTVYSTLFEPAQMLEHYTRRQYWWQAAVAVLLSATLWLFTQLGLAHNQHLGLSLLIVWGSAFIIWWWCSLMLHFSADLFGGKGRFADTMTAVGLAALPLIFIAPLQSLPNLIGDLGYTLNLLGQMGIAFWVLALLTLGLGHSEAFSLDRSIGSLILAFVINLAFIFSIGLIFMLQLMNWGLSL